MRIRINTTLRKYRYRKSVISQPHLAVGLTYIHIVLDPHVQYLRLIVLASMTSPKQKCRYFLVVQLIQKLIFYPPKSYSLACVPKG